MTVQMRMIAYGNAEMTSGLVTMVLVFIRNDDAIGDLIVQTVAMNLIVIVTDVIVTCSDVKTVLVFHDL